MRARAGNTHASHGSTLSRWAAEAHLIHAGGSEEDANLLCIALQLLVLIVAEFQMPLVLPVRLPP